MSNSLVTAAAYEAIREKLKDLRSHRQEQSDKLESEQKILEMTAENARRRMAQLSKSIDSLDTQIADLTALIS